MRAPFSETRKSMDLEERVLAIMLTVAFASALTLAVMAIISLIVATNGVALLVGGPISLALWIIYPYVFKQIS